MIEAGGISTLSPDKKVMTDFLEHLFGGYLDGLHDGLIEISHVQNQGDKPNEYWRSRLFGTDEIEDAVNFAAEMNAQRRNLYVAPALRHPDADRNKRASKDQVMGTVILWCEWDDAIDFEAGQKKYQFTRPTAGIITGQTPYRRCQAFWRLDEALYDLEEIDGALIGLGVALHGDMKVTHADGLMRLAGSVSWRKLDKPERIDELTILAVGCDGMPSSYPTAQILQAFPPATRTGEEKSYPRVEEVERHKSALGFDGRVSDGRETYMRNTVLACLIQFAGENGLWPTPQMLFDMAWPQYSSNADFSRPGRDERELFGKCRYTVRRAEKEQITNRDGSKMTLESAVAGYQVKKEKKTAEIQQKKEDEGLPRKRIKILDLDDIDQLMPPSYCITKLVTETGFTLIWGKQASFKSFVALDMGLCMAYGEPYHGREVVTKTILYIAGEGAGGYRKRVAAWRKHYKKQGIKGKFYMLETAVNLIDAAAVRELIAEIRALNFSLEMLFVDTVARAMVGNDESDATAMGLFVAACDAIRHEFKCGLIAVHHSGKDASLGPRGSSALPAAVDTDFFLERIQGSDTVTVTCQKQKDDEEPAPFQFRAEKIDLGSMGISGESSLVMLPGGAEKKSSLSKHQVNEILKHIQLGWDRKMPWSLKPQTKEEGRFLPMWISRHYEIDVKGASIFMEELIFNGFLITEICDFKSKKAGLKVLKYHD